MKGDVVILATGRDPDVKLNYFTTFAAGRRALKAWAEERDVPVTKHYATKGDEVAALYLFDPVSRCLRGAKNILLTSRLRRELIRSV